jgi:hypothetical protein
MKRAALWQLRLHHGPTATVKDIPAGVDTPVGRGDFGIIDDRCSRKQVWLHVDAYTGHAVVWRTGVNPSFVRDAEPGAEWTRLGDSQQQHELHHRATLKPLLMGPELEVELVPAEAEVTGTVKASGKRTKLVACQYGADW